MEQPQKRAKVTTASVATPLVIGTNTAGQLGKSNCHHRKKPTVINDGSIADTDQALDIDAGGMHTVVLTSDKTVHTFGCNDEGALGRPCDSADDEMVAGVVVGLDGEDVIQVTAGDSHTCALTASGKVFATGLFRDDEGALAFSQSVKKQKEFVQIFPPSASAKATKREVAKLAKLAAVSISSGSNHVLILTSDGSVYSLGNCRQGQLGRIEHQMSERDSMRVTRSTPEWVKGKKTSLAFLQVTLVPAKVPSLPKIEKIFTTSWGSYAIDTKGELWAWGLNNYFQLGVKREDVATPDVVVNCEFFPKIADNLPKGVVEVAGGQHHTLVLTKQGEVFAIGRGESGILGQGDEEASKTPVQVSIKGTKVTGLGAGTVTSYAVGTPTSFAWGFGENLQLTSADDMDVLSPLEMSGSKIEGKTIIKICGGDQHAVMLAK